MAEHYQKYPKKGSVAHEEHEDDYEEDEDEDEDHHGKGSEYEDSLSDTEDENEEVSARSSLDSAVEHEVNQKPNLKIGTDEVEPYRSNSGSSGHSGSSSSGSPITTSFLNGFMKPQGILIGEDEEKGEDDSGWDAIKAAEAQLSRDGWKLHYDADIEEDSDDEDDKSVEFIFSKRDFDYGLEWDTTPVAESFVELSPSSMALTSEQEFTKNTMRIPETPAKEALSKVACQQPLPVDSKVKYYRPDPSIIGGEDYVSQTEPRMKRCASIESFFKIKRMIDVQFYLSPGNRMVSKECRLDATIYQLKMAIGRYVKVPPNHLDIRRNKNLVSDDKMLLDLGGKSNKKIKFVVEINRRIPGNYEIKMHKDRVVTPRKNTNKKVHIETDEGFYNLNVTVVYPTQVKPMLGGFIDQRTRITYHHAETSMEKTVKPMRQTPEFAGEKFPEISTSVQAFGNKITGIQTLLDKGQQMDRRGVYLPVVNDKEIEARPYKSHAFWEFKRRKAVVIIQRYWRRWLAIKERNRRLDGLIKRVKWAENIRKGRLDQRLKIMNEEILRQENPKRMVDLELLYRAINNWRKEEEAYVDDNRWGPERKAALATLAEIEADLLLDLERTKNRINVEEEVNRNKRAFGKMGEPKRWLSAKTPNFITIDNGEKVHVRQLQGVYIQLQKPVEHTDEGIVLRCKLLGQLNHLTKDVTSKMAEMLNELVSRELTYLRRPKCSNALLAGVRKRIATTFFFLCQDPDFNKEAKRVQKVPWDPIKLRKDMVQCKGCRRMQYRDEFTIIKGTTVTSRCHTCMNLYRTAILRVDLNLYRHMLKEIRRDEMAAGVVNSVTFLIDAFDLQFLVEQIWHGQSALSGIDNRYLLRLCRWKKEKPWAPWNCVLLTEEEATAHLQLENMEDAYKGSFFHKVLVKQCTAKTYFEGLSKLGIGLDARIEENCQEIKNKKKRTQVIKEKMMKRAKFLQMLRS